MEDLTGKNRFIYNVLTGWGSYIVFLISGFILPRLIDNNLSQVSLGIWDFGWSIINYLSVTDIGVGGSINRFVGKYRMENNIEELNGTISSAVLFQVALGMLILMICLVLAWQAPVLFSDKFANEIEPLRYVIIFLGGSLAAQFAFGASRGVITGVHRWDLNNILNAATRMVGVLLIASALLLGGGLAVMSFLYFLTRIVSELARVYLVFRVCPELKLSFSSVTVARFKRIFSFGTKTYLLELTPVIILQSTAILIANALGPSFLAVYNRPIALLHFIQTFIQRLAMVIIPTVGSLQSRGDMHEIKQLFLDTSRFSVAMALPGILFLMFFGDVLMYYWMGEDYVAHNLIIILSIGYFFFASQKTAVSVLEGLNQHGKVAVITFVISIVFFGVGVLVLNSIGWTIDRAGFNMVLPLAISFGMIIPLYTAKLLDISYSRFLTNVFMVPLLINVVFAGILYVCKALVDDMLIGMFTGGALGGVVLLLLYWQFLISSEYKVKIAAKLFGSKKKAEESAD